MGYRSDVAIKCQRKAYEKFKEAYEKVDFNPDKTYRSSDSDEVIIRWEWVKWYDDYKEIKAVEDVMKELDDIEEPYEKELAYKMIRLGEDDGDIEARENSGWELEFYYVRSFDTEGFEEVKA